MRQYLWSLDLSITVIHQNSYVFQNKLLLQTHAIRNDGINVKVTMMNKAILILKP